MEKQALLHEVGGLLRDDSTILACEEKLKATNDEAQELPAKTKGCCFRIPKRYALCFLVFLGFLIMNSERSCLSVAIVAMSSKRRIKVDGKWTTKVAIKHLYDLFLT